MMPWTDEGIGWQGAETSRNAAEAVSDAASLREQIMRQLHASPFPMTSEELAERIGRDYGSVQPRTSELKHAGAIRDSGIRRRGRFGKPIIAWELTPTRRTTA